MQRIAFQRLVPTCRHFSTTLPAAAKGKKPTAPRANSDAALRGTGVGASSRLYSPEEVVGGQPTSQEQPVRPTAPDALEKDMLDSQGLTEPEPAVEVDEKLRGTGVGASHEAYPAGEKVEGRDNFSGE